MDPLRVLALAEMGVMYRDVEVHAAMRVQIAAWDGWGGEGGPL